MQAEASDLIMEEDFEYYMSGGLARLETVEEEVRLLEEEDSKLLGTLKTLNMQLSCQEVKLRSKILRGNAEKSKMQGFE